MSISICDSLLRENPHIAAFCVFIVSYTTTAGRFQTTLNKLHSDEGSEVLLRFELIQYRLESIYLKIPTKWQPTGDQKKV